MFIICMFPSSWCHKTAGLPETSKWHWKFRANEIEIKDEKTNGWSLEMDTEMGDGRTATNKMYKSVLRAKLSNKMKKEFDLVEQSVQLFKHSKWNISRFEA